MHFEWDEAKNESNIRRHGIDFADIPSMFLAPMLTDIDDRIDYSEERWISIGILVHGITVVVWTERAGDVIRIISARKANKDERRQYENTFTD